MFSECYEKILELAQKRPLVDIRLLVQTILIPPTRLYCVYEWIKRMANKYMYGKKKKT